MGPGITTIQQVFAAAKTLAELVGGRVVTRSPRARTARLRSSRRVRARQSRELSESAATEAQHLRRGPDDRGARRAVIRRRPAAFRPLRSLRSRYIVRNIR